MYLALWLQIMGGAINDFGPMLIISFITQEITYVKDSKGNIVEGDPVSTIVHVWILMIFILKNGIDWMFPLMTFLEIYKEFKK